MMTPEELEVIRKEIHGVQEMLIKQLSEIRHEMKEQLNAMDNKEDRRIDALYSHIDSAINKVVLEMREELSRKADKEQFLDFKTRAERKFEKLAEEAKRNDAQTGSLATEMRIGGVVFMVLLGAVVTYLFGKLP